MAKSPTTGFTGRQHSPQTRAKMRLAHLGNQCALGYRHTEEDKLRMSEARLGNTHMLGHRHSPETLLKLSAVHKGKPKSAAWRAAMSGSNNYFWGKTPTHGHRGKRTPYAGTIFRSTFEARFAKALDRLGMDWLYESKRFDLGDLTYLPDFYVPATEAYWEVKGWFDPKSQRRVKLFRELHPDIPLIVADEAVLKAMEVASKPEEVTMAAGTWKIK